MSRICMLVFSYYPSDPRVRREAEALVEAGMTVDVICLKGTAEPRKEVVNGVSVLRLPLQRKRAGKLRYIWEYFCFILLTFFYLSVLSIRKRYNLVHVHNMPDILVFSAIIPRIAGAKLILDLHDPMPEVYMTKYSIDASHPVIQLLIFLEKCSIRFSSLVLTPNVAFRNLFISRRCPDSKIHVVMNLPDESIFCAKNSRFDKSNQHDSNKFVIMYHGTIVERHGLDTALFSINNVRKSIPGLEFHVYGEGDFVNRFIELVDKLNLDNIVKYHGHVSQETIAASIESIDVGLIPNKKTPFTYINLPTRIFEYLCMGKPVIAPVTRGILDYFDEDSLHFFEPGNAESLENALLDVYSNLSKSRAVLERGISIYKKHRWEIEKQHFVKLVKNLFGEN